MKIARCRKETRDNLRPAAGAQRTILLLFSAAVDHNRARDLAVGIRLLRVLEAGARKAEQQCAATRG